ncbi:hypothetical protein [Phenylobacterium sp.]|uniref:hypothetical protein n=1 Tax=Phenylobacterium sp. TaxID=1871053 RepID=UPI002DF6C284|nr:hypothetical protein [Phenylobacterium sp.]
MPKSQSRGGPADPSDPQAVARDMREKLEAAKRRMRAYRDEMEASGLAHTHDDDEAAGPAGDGG